MAAKSVVERDAFQDKIARLFALFLGKCGENFIFSISFRKVKGAVRY